jgi:xylan 1,4-beta-xylosidase
MESAHFHCDWQAPTTPLPHVWEHTVGSCHALLALRADWQAQLRRCHEELGFRHVRFHGLLCDDMSTCILWNKRLLCSFHNADCIWDYLLSIGMRPFVELSFMPRALASGRKTVFHYHGNITPPRSYQQWARLIESLAAHWVERYGRREVRQWYFEVWNEPNLKIFWSGSQREYFRLYEYTVRALKRVDQQLRVGGPATAKEKWIGEFLDYCRRRRLPVDFVSTHHYPNDVIWREKQPTEDQLACSQRSILRDWTREARLRAGDRPLYYTEWNCSSNGRYPPQDESYAAAFVTKTILEAAHLVDCYSFWTFSDIFEEGYFPSLPFHGGFGLLNIHGIPKPTYRAFQILHRLGTEQFPVAGNHSTVDAWLVRQSARTATVVLTNHALPRHHIQTVRVEVDILDSPRPLYASVERIDQEHANASTAWRAMGAPEYLTPADVQRLETASQLVAQPMRWKMRDRAVHLELDLPPHAVTAIHLRFDRVTE